MFANVFPGDPSPARGRETRLPRVPPGSSSSSSASPSTPARRARAVRPPPVQPATTSELLIAAAIALILVAFAIGGALFDGSRTFVPGSREHLASPWSDSASVSPIQDAEGRVEAVPLDRHDLVGVGHHDLVGVDHDDPVGVDLAARRYTIEALAEGHLPAWNPLLGTGQPWLANPRHGVFDPQVLAQAALQRAGGRDLAQRGFAWLAWLRLAAAGLGAYVLARRSGTRSSAAALAGLGFAGSGLALAHVTSPVGHVMAVVPWVFVAIDRLREHPHVRSVAFVALATALLALGGSPETSFMAGLAALTFTAVALEGRARALGVAGLVLGTACAAPALLPFLESLPDSDAFVSRRAAWASKSGFDVLSIGLVLVTIAIVAAWRKLVHDAETAERRGDEARAVARLASALPELGASLPAGESSRAPSEPAAAAKGRRSAGWQANAGLVGVVLAIVTCAYVAAERGAAERGRAWLLVDAWSTPGADTATAWTQFARVGGAWVACVVVAMALASFLSAGGPLRARTWWQVTAVVSLALATGVGGFVDAWRWLPLFGLADTSSAAAVSALAFAMLAAEGLDASPRSARRAAALVYVALVGLALFARPPAAPGFAPDPDEPYFSVTERPPVVWTNSPAFVAGHVATTLPAERVRVRADRIDADGHELQHDVRVFVLDLAAPDAQGRRAFRTEPIDVAGLEAGTWRFSLAFERARAGGGVETMGTRVVAYTSVAHEPRIGPVSMFSTMIAFLLLLFVAGTRSNGAWIASAAVAGQVLAWSSVVWGTVPAATRFGSSATETFLSASAARGRILAAPDVLPGDTSLFAKIPNVQGSDEFATARSVAFRRPLSNSENGASGTGARDADVTRLREIRPESGRIDPARVDVHSNAFRLLGVTHVVARRVIELPGFDPVAGPRSAADVDTAPGRDPATVTEAYVWAARDPMPRAFCVTSTVERHRAMSGPAAFDPAVAAFLGEGRSWTPRRPATRTDVRIELDAGDRTRLTADVDGDALLVLTDAFASGWKATVDGREAEILLVDDAFRGVILEAGRHVVEFEYAPTSLRVGVWIFVVASLILWIAMVVPRRYG